MQAGVPAEVREQPHGCLQASLALAVTIISIQHSLHIIPVCLRLEVVPGPGPAQLVVPGHVPTSGPLTSTAHDDDDDDDDG